MELQSVRPRTLCLHRLALPETSTNEISGPERSGVLGTLRCSPARRACGPAGRAENLPLQLPARRRDGRGNRGAGQPWLLAGPQMPAPGSETPGRAHLTPSLLGTRTFPRSALAPVSPPLHWPRFLSMAGTEVIAPHWVSPGPLQGPSERTLCHAQGAECLSALGDPGGGCGGLWIRCQMGAKHVLIPAHKSLAYPDPEKVLVDPRWESLKKGMTSILSTFLTPQLRPGKAQRRAWTRLLAGV